MLQKSRRSRVAHLESKPFRHDVLFLLHVDDNPRKAVFNTSKNLLSLPAEVKAAVNLIPGAVVWLDMPGRRRSIAAKFGECIMEMTR